MLYTCKTNCMHCDDDYERQTQIAFDYLPTINYAFKEVTRFVLEANSSLKSHKYRKDCTVNWIPKHQLHFTWHFYELVSGQMCREKKTFQEEDMEGFNLRLRSRW